MKKPNIFFYFLILLLGFIHINAKEENSTTENHLETSISELDAAFIVAVKKNNLEKMKELIQAGANVHTLIPYTWTSGDCDWMIESTPLIYAVRSNRPNMVKALLKTEKKLNVAFEEAIQNGFSAVVVELIKGGANINYVNKNKDTPLIIAIQNARATSEFSLQANEKARSRWYDRRTIIKSLLEGGANINHVNKYGNTALMEAVTEHDLNTVQTLLEIPEINTGSYFGFGTKPINYANKDGNTALILAIKSVNYTYINGQEYNICKNSQSIVNVLLETPGIDPYHINKNGETAIELLEKLKKEMDKYPY